MILVLIVALIWAGAARAEPPQGSEGRGPLHGWFSAQHSVNGVWCCDVSDGHVLADKDWHLAGDHYEVRIGSSWYIVPPEAMRDPRGGPNPTGAAIVWYSQAIGQPPTIFCFAKGFEY